MSISLKIKKDFLRNWYFAYSELQIILLKHFNELIKVYKEIRTCISTLQNTQFKSLFLLSILSKKYISSIEKNQSQYIPVSTYFINCSF